jgi:long-subunit acyl-CoA synthetase (AMP-forming)
MEALSLQLTQAMAESTLAQWALTNGLIVAEQELNGGTVSWFMRKKHNFYRKQRDKMKTKYAKTIKTLITYGEPLETKTVYFFHTLGWNVLQSFGETETCGFATMDDPNDARPLTAGKAIGSLEVEIERYGPIVVKGDMVAKGYYNDAKASANAFDAQGFFQCKTKGHLDNFRLVVAPSTANHAERSISAADETIIIE